MAFGGFSILVCRPRDSVAPQPGVPTKRNIANYDDSRDFAAIFKALGDADLHFVGRRPKNEIDALLTDRVMVIGDDADLNAVVLRLLRKKRLADVAIAYVAPRATPATRRWTLPTGVRALETALHGEVDLVSLVRNDAGGVLVGRAHLAPVTGTVYVDENRMLSGAARVVTVEPDNQQGLAVTIARKRIFGFGRRPATTLGRAVEFGLATKDTAIVFDGISHPRTMNRWVFYKHTEPLRLIRGVY